MKNIAVDLDVYKELEKRRESFEESYNDILRRVFELQPMEGVSLPTTKKKLRAKGGALSEGLRLRAKYKGVNYYAEVRGEQVLYQGVLYKSPSAAGTAVTGNPVNGWRFWQALVGDDPNKNGNWVKLNEVRESQNRRIKNRERGEEKLLSLIRKNWSIGDEFTLSEAYDKLGGEWRVISKAKDWKANMRFYLQRLRDSGYIEFIDDKGTYKRLK